MDVSSTCSNEKKGKQTNQKRSTKNDVAKALISNFTPRLVSENDEIIPPRKTPRAPLPAISHLFL